MGKKSTAPPEDVQSIFHYLTTELHDSSTKSDQNFTLKQIYDIRGHLEKEVQTHGRLRRRY